MNELIEILSGICSGEGFENSEDLIADGFLDSLDIVQVSAELENNFDIEITPVDVTHDNFKSVNSIYGNDKKTGTRIRKERSYAIQYAYLSMRVSSGCFGRILSDTKKIPLGGSIIGKLCVLFNNGRSAYSIHSCVFTLYICCRTLA